MNKLDWEKKLSKVSLLNKDWYEISLTLRTIGLKHQELELLTIAELIRKEIVK